MTEMNKTETHEAVVKYIRGRSTALNEDDGCWIWKQRLRWMRRMGKYAYAHRLPYQAANGILPKVKRC